MIFDKLFQLMAERRASDIFITAGAPIHAKVQGDTQPLNQQVMTPAMIQHMVDEFITPEQKLRFESDRELNVSHGVAGLGNFRINLFWQRNSISVVMRFIQGQIPALEELGLPPELAGVVQEKRGLVLIVGSTGSGKSTTLASMVDHRNRTCSGHILTIEDPIEYLFKHRKSLVNQREVGIDTHSWHEALRNAMRQAPDCILIGEIRDRETMQAALAYAQAGHLCLATLHANNAHHALNRITHFFPLDNRPLLHLDLAVALRCIVSQRLVKQPDGKRIAAVEMLMNTRHIGELIESGALGEIREAMEKSLCPGSQTFEQDLFRLHREGRISLDEALSHADSPTNLSWLINHSQHGNESDGAEHAPSSAAADLRFQSFSLSLDERPGG